MGTHYRCLGEALVMSTMCQHSSLVVERPLCDWEVTGSVPSRVMPKTSKKVLAVFVLCASIKKVELELVSLVSV